MSLDWYQIGYYDSAGGSIRNRVQAYQAGYNACSKYDQGQHEQKQDSIHDKYKKFKTIEAELTELGVRLVYEDRGYGDVISIDGIEIDYEYQDKKLRAGN